MGISCSAYTLTQYSVSSEHMHIYTYMYVLSLFVAVAGEFVGVVGEFVALSQYTSCW